MGRSFQAMHDDHLGPDRHLNRRGEEPDIDTLNRRDEEPDWDTLLNQPPPDEPDIDTLLDQPDGEEQDGNEGNMMRRLFIASRVGDPGVLAQLDDACGLLTFNSRVEL